MCFAYCINNIRKNYDVRHRNGCCLSWISLWMEIITVGDETVTLKKKKIK